jgi:hypothetical protein
MRTLAIASLLLMSGLLGLAQDSSELLDKAPPAIDEALRARVDQFYQAFVAGKYKDAYLLVEDASQNAFLEADKQQYRGCETLRTRYSDNFTKAVVVVSCRSEWKWHGIVTPTTFPITSHWVIENGMWCWHYVKPTQIQFPFSPTGFVPVPTEETEVKPGAPAIPADMQGAARNILAQVSLDKRAVHVRPDQSSEDVIHVRNGMPGMITLTLEHYSIPGLNITIGKTQLQAHEETTVRFAWRLDDPAVLCPDCVKKTSGEATVQLKVAPTGQTFSIKIAFDSAPPTIPPQVPPPPPHK